MQSSFCLSLLPSVGAYVEVANKIRFGIPADRRSFTAYRRLGSNMKQQFQLGQTRPLHKAALGAESLDVPRKHFAEVPRAHCCLVLLEFWLWVSVTRQKLMFDESNVKTNGAFRAVNVRVSTLRKSWFWSPQCLGKCELAGWKPPTVLRENKPLQFSGTLSVGTLWVDIGGQQRWLEAEDRSQVNYRKMSTMQWATWSQLSCSTTGATMYSF